VPIAAPPKGTLASQGAIAAAKVAPAALINPARPPALPPKVNFNDQIQVALKTNVNRDGVMYRPLHWEYVEYDMYRRPTFFNPLATDAAFRYFYNGAYQTVFVPAGGRVLIDMVEAAVFPFTVAAGDLISVGSFLGGAWIPPVDWVGPPPADFVPFTPVTYSAVPVNFSNAGQTVMVDQVTRVGHDDMLPQGQQDILMLNDSTLARGDVLPGPEGGPPEILVSQTQPLPGVGQWDNGQQYINTAVEKPVSSGNSHLPWVIGGLAAVLALLGGVAAWVWKHPRGDHASTGAPAMADALTGPLESYSPADEPPNGHGDYPPASPPSPDVASSGSDMWRRPPFS